MEMSRVMMCVQGELQRVFSFGVSRFGRESCLVIFIESHCHVAFEDVIVESGCFDVERLRGEPHNVGEC